MEAWETLAATHAVPSHYRNREAVVRRLATGSLSCNSSFLVEVPWLILKYMVHLYYGYSCPPAEAQGEY